MKVICAHRSKVVQQLDQRVAFEKNVLLEFETIIGQKTIISTNCDIYFTVNTFRSEEIKN